MLGAEMEDRPVTAGLTRLTAELATRLDGINWNFVVRLAPSALEGVHPYPAKFIGDIPRSLISTIGLPPNTVVFDPFCGSGATLVESQRLGYEAIGIDLNPIACLISRVKTKPLPKGIQKALADVILSSRFSARSEQAGSNIPNVGHWFREDVRRALEAVVESIRSEAPPRTHDFLFAALSSIIVRVSNQESDTRYAAISKAVTADDVFEEFEASCDRLQKALAARDYPLTPCRVIAENTLEIDAEKIGRNVGLVITSPPYPNAYEYWLYHKYRMWWLGYDPIEVRAHEIGARPHFFKKNHQTEDDFSRQMALVFGLFREVLVSGGHACFVIGRSKIHGRLIDNASLLCDAAAAHRMPLVYQRERVIRSDRKSFNLAHAKIKTETLLVFRAE